MQKIKRQITPRLMQIGLLVAALVVGTLFREVKFGVLFLLAYAIFAFVRRIEAGVTFSMAIVMLVGMPATDLLHNHTLSQNFATYGFLLLLLGTVQLVVEQYRLNRKA
ncbi:MAG TPA: hypothetical protein VLG11_04795 [Candidatus Saccharimonadales bacterium]|nr:hypothetical protein [Candidatus Saccharimonadales bacterium]